MTAAGYHRFCCGLELAAGLNATSTRWTFGEWAGFLRMFRATEARVIVLKVIYEMSLSEIGERMELSRSRIDEIWKRAIRRATKTAGITRFITQHMEGSDAGGIETGRGTNRDRPRCGRRDCGDQSEQGTDRRVRAARETGGP